MSSTLGHVIRRKHFVWRHLSDTLLSSGTSWTSDNYSVCSRISESGIGGEIWYLRLNCSENVFKTSVKGRSHVARFCTAPIRAAPHSVWTRLYRVDIFYRSTGREREIVCELEWRGRCHTHTHTQWLCCVELDAIKQAPYTTTFSRVVCDRILSRCNRQHPGIERPSAL